MKSWQFNLIGVLAATVIIAACSKVEQPAETAPAPAVAPAPAPAAPVNEPGGYVPSDEERYHPSAADAAAPEAPASATPEAVAPAATPDSTTSN